MGYWGKENALILFLGIFEVKKGQLVEVMGFWW